MHRDAIIDLFRRAGGESPCISYGCVSHRSSNELTIKRQCFAMRSMDTYCHLAVVIYNFTGTIEQFCSFVVLQVISSDFRSFRTRRHVVKYHFTYTYVCNTGFRFVHCTQVTADGRSYHVDMGWFYIGLGVHFLEAIGAKQYMQIAHDCTFYDLLIRRRFDRLRHCRRCLQRRESCS